MIDENGNGNASLSRKPRRKTVRMIGMDISCGCVEMVGLQDGIEDFLTAFERDRGREPFVIFSDPDEYDNGGSIYREMKTTKYRKFGTVFRTDAKLNPNSGNHIRVYIWQPSDRYLAEMRKNWKEEPHNWAWERITGTKETRRKSKEKPGYDY